MIQVPLDRAIMLLGFVREEPKNSNRGQAIEAFLKLTGLGPGFPWCAAFVAYVMRTLFGKLWPLPLTAGCVVLGDAAEAKGMLADKPQPGDIFLMYYPSLKRFAHTGFVVGPGENGEWETIEGNTGDVGEREGYGVFRKSRKWGKHDRFIRWTGIL